MQSTIYVEMAPGISTEELYQHLKSVYEVHRSFLEFIMSYPSDFLFISSFKRSRTKNLYLCCKIRKSLIPDMFVDQITVL